MIVNFITAYLIQSTKTFICHSWLKMITVKIEAPTRKNKQKYTSKWKSVPKFKGKVVDYCFTQIRLIY